MLFHDFRHDLQDILRGQIVPHAIGGEQDDVAVSDLVVLDIRVLGGFRKLLAPAEDGVLGLHTGWDFRELVRGIESVRLSL